MLKSTVDFSSLAAYAPHLTAVHLTNVPLTSIQTLEKVPGIKARAFIQALPLSRSSISISLVSHLFCFSCLLFTALHCTQDLTVLHPSYPTYKLGEKPLTRPWAFLSSLQDLETLTVCVSSLSMVSTQGVRVRSLTKLSPSHLTCSMENPAGPDRLDLYSAHGGHV